MKTRQAKKIIRKAYESHIQQMQAPYTDHAIRRAASLLKDGRTSADDLRRAAFERTVLGMAGQTFSVRTEDGTGCAMTLPALLGMLCAAGWTADVTDGQGRRTRFMEGGPGEQDRLTGVLLGMRRTGEGLELKTGSRLHTVSAID